MSQSPTNPTRRPPPSAARRARQRAYRRPSLLARLRSLKGGKRIAVFGGMLAVVVAIFVATGSTAYGLNLENHDDFCASCHTQPETQYYQQSREQNSTTLAAFHASKSVRCIDCHSGGGPLGRVEGLTQGTQDLLSYYSGQYHNPAITTSKLSDDSCLKCHAEIMGRGSFDNHYHLFLSRWQSADPNAAGCVDCHRSHPAADASQQFLSTTQVQAICQQCHAVLRERE